MPNNKPVPWSTTSLRLFKTMWAQGKPLKMIADTTGHTFGAAKRMRYTLKLTPRRGTGANRKQIKIMVDTEIAAGLKKLASQFCVSQTEYVRRMLTREITKE